MPSRCDTRDSELNIMEAFVSKKKRQLGDLKDEDKRLRSERSRLRADRARKASAVVAQLESQLKDANTVPFQRCKTILDEMFAEVFDLPIVSYRGL